MRKIHHPLLKPLGPWTLWSEWTPCVWDEACPQGLLVQPTARAGRTKEQRSAAHLRRTGEEEEKPRELGLGRGPSGTSHTCSWPGAAQ